MAVRTKTAESCNAKFYVDEKLPRSAELKKKKVVKGNSCGALRNHQNYSTMWGNTNNLIDPFGNYDMFNSASDFQFIIISLLILSSAMQKFAVSSKHSVFWKKRFN